MFLGVDVSWRLRTVTITASCVWEFSCVAPFGCSSVVRARPRDDGYAFPGRRAFRARVESFTTSRSFKAGRVVLVGGRAGSQPFLLTRSWKEPFTVRKKSCISSHLTTLHGGVALGYGGAVERSVAMQLFPTAISSSSSSSSSSSPLLSLVQVQAKLAINLSIHTQHTYDNGVDRTGDRVFRKIQLLHEEREEEKNFNPQTMLHLEYSLRTEKKHLSTKAHIP